mmetsp:Transcript_20829/g.51863  ORF Transcript_20829/g.51863 Transcript_20829/m.51863 type:complete len:113 (+) Transcript_20829:264-602(+)
MRRDRQRRRVVQPEGGREGSGEALLQPGSRGQTGARPPHAARECAVRHPEVRGHRDQGDPPPPGAFNFGISGFVYRVLYDDGEVKDEELTEEDVKAGTVRWLDPTPGRASES